MSKINDYLKGYLQAQNIWIANASVEAGVPDLESLSKFRATDPLSNLVGDEILDKSKAFILGFNDGFNSLSNLNRKLHALLEDALGG